MTTYPQDDNHRRGTWKELNTPTARSASFTCPLCGQTGLLIDHQIAPDGTVSPSVVCSHEECTFHEFIQLEGWAV